MNFSLRLENLIQEKNITQKQLAGELHMAASTLNGYITEHREPDFETLAHIARYFDVSTDYLLCLTDLKKPAPSSLTSAEINLIHHYRRLKPERQILLTEQARFYYIVDSKTKRTL